MNINDLIKERNDKIRAAKNILDKAEKDNEGKGRKLTDGERGQYDKLVEEADEIMIRVQDLQKAEELEKTTTKPVKETDKELNEEERYSEVWNKWIRLRKGEQLTYEESRILETRAQSTTTTAGGYLIPEGFGAKIIEYLQAYGGMREASYVFNTATGNDLPFPTIDDTSNAGSLLAENAQISESALTFGQVTLNSYMYTSGLVLASWQLLQDSYFDFDSFLAKQLGVRLGRITNTDFTTGSGSSKPKGITIAATAGKTTASTTVVTRSEVVDLIHSVDPAYRGNPKTYLMFADSTLKALRKLVDGDSRPIYQPNFSTGVFDTIEGEKFIVNQDMPAYGTATNRFMCYGDFSYYFIRDVLPMGMATLTERYADYLQNGYFAYLRTDGDLLNTSAVKYMKHAAS